MNNTLIITIVCLTALIGCNSTSSTQQPLAPYLDQFIGQTAEQVKSNIDFKKFNFETVKQPIKDTQQALSYRILRPVKIPIPSYTAMSTGSTPTSIQSGSLAQSYDLNFYCDITFTLEQDIVTQWSYTGKAC